MSLREAIEIRIAEFLATNNSKLEWVKPVVREHAFLPLYVGWVAALGVRSDGSFVRWDHEDDRARVKPLSDPFWQRMAICQGAKLYPELRALLPERPAAALTCDGCGGSGRVPWAPQAVCRCGGAGWVIPGEQRENSPG